MKFTDLAYPLKKTLIDAFDRHIGAQHYKSRSEAIRDFIHEELIRKQWTKSGTVAGAIVITYDHHKRELVNLLLDIQHDVYGNDFNPACAP